MIQFERFNLSNGLRILFHEDKSTPLVAVNILYDVGAKDEQKEKTGFAHLFEHLMFGGSKNAPNFDTPVQNAGGESNAFTNSDITNFFNTVPSENLEPVLWLESDRMKHLNINEKSLGTQKKVVIEEFKENYLNVPYGRAWHLLLEMAYKEHPYNWPTIGKTPEHIEEAKLEEVQDFFNQYYCPNNAILVIAGNTDLPSVKTLCQKWFGDIPKGPSGGRKLIKEPIQTEFREMEMEDSVPADALYLAFHMPSRDEPDYYATDLLSDILSNGRSARLFRRLVKEDAVFDTLDAYVSGHFEAGLFVIEGKPTEKYSLQESEAKIWKELNLLKEELVNEAELTKIKNKIESNLIYAEVSILNKAINLAYFEALGDAAKINEESKKYQQVSPQDIQRMAATIFQKSNCSKLLYRAKETKSTANESN